MFKNYYSLFMTLFCTNEWVFIMFETWCFLQVSLCAKFNKIIWFHEVIYLFVLFLLKMLHVVLITFFQYLKMIIYILFSNWSIVPQPIVHVPQFGNRICIAFEKLTFWYIQSIIINKHFKSMKQYLIKSKTYC